MRVLSWLLFIFVVTLFSGAKAQTTKQFKLPNGLKEISGLAVASPNTVYAHNDEHAIVYEIDVASGEVLSAFALGGKTVKGDFEGIAVSQGRVYLITSGGRIYEAPIGEHRERVRYNTYDTGVGSLCEIEGLITAPDAESEFLILCKTPRREDLAGKLLIYRWPHVDRAPVSEPWRSVELSSFLSAEDAATFRPSGIEWDPISGAFILISARNHLLVRFDPETSEAEAIPMNAKAHNQAEGIARLSNGVFVISDEGNRAGPGTLTWYQSAPFD
ncbi:MAG: hypothetical protein HKN14_03530 [Marinicaulis sp.]|nr:hypothetical protein [Marinicaulis sp.]NNE39974.1 hypothetical protein [Marinicaulis sp.]NNL90497.1 hypothetical protein [Marinicaulis sp.]